MSIHASFSGTSQTLSILTHVFSFVSTHVSHIFHLAINTREITVKSCVNVDKSIDTIILLSNTVSTINQITCQIKLCQSTCQILLSEASILPPGALLLYHCLHLRYTYQNTHDILLHDTLLLLMLTTLIDLIFFCHNPPLAFPTTPQWQTKLSSLLLHL